MQDIGVFAQADHFGRRLDWAPLAAERTSALKAELEEVMDGQERRYELIHRRLGRDETEREIASAVNKNAATIHRTMPTAEMMTRVCVLAAVVHEAQTLWGLGVFSLRSSKAKPKLCQTSFIVQNPQSRSLARRHPDRVRLQALIKQQRHLLELAADHKRDVREPLIRSWQSGPNRWTVDFPLVCADRAETLLAAREVGATEICHIQSGLIEYV